MMMTTISEYGRRLKIAIIAGLLGALVGLGLGLSTCL